ncbi:TetR/AcrR family transcriptional regulator [Streptomyces sp. NBC_01264]|uniref:TetR/AcrR family transcriptional regulator n=1 Tax=Streptomyces sp. NBC_01264 TaxID=2903804 RepID=UPI002254F679|nr:TetR/AcrR family transcriptional regulator [Streptomyces sp. NBC_01264]MCX4775637.1 TetR/AcrR family transcriptional regulator [Streptomyces sp. NBC_01264]
MQPSSPEPANRFERRRAQTRSALIGAARAILAERGNTEVSIQVIAERADVGFGSFYNHFETKDALFDAAVADALEEYGQLLDAATGSIDDPAETFATSVRLALRLAASHPEMTGVLRFRGLQHVHGGTGFAPRALRDLEVGRASGRFSVADAQVALSAVGGALLGMVQLGATTDLDEAAGEQTAEMILRMLGVPADEARELSTRPLPDLGE